MRSNRWKNSNGTTLAEKREDAGGRLCTRASRTEGITYTNVNRHVIEGRAEPPGLRDAA
jgi:hypothetical protein